MVLGQAAVLYQRRRDGQAALASAEAFLFLAQEQGFSFRAATGLIYRGWALAECGNINAGIPQIRAGLGAVEETGAILARPYYLALLGETYRKAGQIEEGLQVLKEALALARAHDDRFYEAEVWRLTGVLLQQKANRNTQRTKITAEAERCFQQACKVARRQKAKSFELRATIHLAQVWAARREEKKAYRLLNKVYAWFTEGFDTIDLQEAHALLKQRRLGKVVKPDLSFSHDQWSYSHSASVQE